MTTPIIVIICVIIFAVCLAIGWFIGAGSSIKKIKEQKKNKDSKENNNEK